jgi:hypothetical protein
MTTDVLTEKMRFEIMAQARFMVDRDTRFFEITACEWRELLKPVVCLLAERHASIVDDIPFSFEDSRSKGLSDAAEAIRQSAEVYK